MLSTFWGFKNVCLPLIQHSCQWVRKIFYVADLQCLNELFIYFVVNIMRVVRCSLSRFLIIMSGSDASSTTESVTQCNTDDKTYIKAPIIDWSVYDLNSDFLLRIASATRDSPFVAPHSTGSVTDDTLPWLRLLLIVTLQRRLCDC